MRTFSLQLGQIHSYYQVFYVRMVCIMKDFYSITIIQTFDNENFQLRAGSDTLLLPGVLRENGMYHEGFVLHLH